MGNRRMTRTSGGGTRGRMFDLDTLVVGKYCPNGDGFDVGKFGLMAFSHEIHI